MNDDRELSVRLERWLDTQDPPVVTERLSEDILAAVATLPQERPLVRPLGLAADRGRTLRVLGVAAALLLGLGGLAALVAGGPRPAVVVPPPASASPVAIAPSPTPTPRATLNPYPEVARRIPLDGHTWQVIATPTRTWVQVGDVGAVALDAVSGEVVAEVPGVSWMWLDGDDLWLQQLSTATLLRVDPESGAERERFENIPAPFIAKDGNTVWALRGDTRRLSRIDLASGEEVASIPVCGDAKQAVRAAGSVWVICDDGSALQRIDPEANEVIDTIDVGTGPVELEYGFESLWVRNRLNQLVRVEPSTGDVIATIEGFGSSPSLGLSFGGGFVWASILTPPGIAAVDPATNQIVRRIPLPGATFMDTYWQDGTLWVTTAFDRLLLEVDVGTP